MTLLLHELFERLKGESELDLIDYLQLTSEDIVNAFTEKIEENYEQLSLGYEEDEKERNFDPFDSDQEEEDY